MTPRTIAGILRARAQSSLADQLAIRFKEGATWVEWTWARYWTAARAVEAGLVAAGVRPGDHVLLLVPEVRPAVAALFGVWALGAVPIQIGLPFQLTDPAAFLGRLRATAQRLDARFLVVAKHLAPFAAADGPCFLAVEDLLETAAAGELPDPEDAPGPAFIQLTSGSTASPRGVVVSHDGLLRHMAAMSTALHSGPDSVAVSWLPLHHDMGLLGGLLFPFYNGFAAHLITPTAFRQRPACWLEAMSRFRGTICAAPPSAYALCGRLAPRLIEAGLDLSPWRCAMIGAEPISADVLRGFSAAFAPSGFRSEAFFPVYGLAEATVAVTFPTPGKLPQLDRVDRTILEREGRAVPIEPGSTSIELVGVGRPIPYTEIRIVDQNGTDLPGRLVGEILVRSPMLMVGYYADRQATTAVLRDGWLYTGDLGYQAEGMLFVTGRTKELIIKGGHNLIPSVLEEIASEVEGVRAGGVAAVGARSPEHQTERVVLVVETCLKVESQPRLAEQIRAALKSHGIALDLVLLVPRHTLPRTTSGKLQRRAVAHALEAGVRIDAATDWSCLNGLALR
jgi:acyl-CoA synthetase (AMP-forming)/AMP-acid ligase II